MANLVAPDLPKDYNPAETLFQGFMAVASVNNRKKALALEEQKMAQDIVLKDRQLDLQARGQNLDYQVASEGQKVLAEEKMFKMGKTTAQLKAAAALTSGVRSIKAPLGSQEWKTEALNHLLNNPDAQQTPAYESIYEQVKPRATNTNLGQKAYNGLIQNLGIDKNLINRAIENPQSFTKAEAQGKIGIHVGDVDEQIPVLDEDGKPQTGPDGQPVMKAGVRPVYQNINKSSWEALKKYRETYGDDESTGKELDLETAKRITAEIKHAHPDWDKERIKNEAIITARRNGYEFQ